MTDSTVKHTPVSRDDAIAFLESACRNWSHVPALSEDDIGDVASELLRFAIKRSAAPEMLEALKAAMPYVARYESAHASNEALDVLGMIDAAIAKATGQ